MSMRFTILGSGASAGVPLIGCECAVCQSDDERNQRTRVSVLVEAGDKCLLVDASPDLRQQALKNRLKTIDALLVTHAHADHCHGLDDVRSFNYHADKVLPLYADSQTLEELKVRFAYVLEPMPQRPHGWYRAALEPHTLSMHRPLELGNGLTVWPFPQEHGRVTVTGIRVGNMAYSTDVKAFPPESEPYLEDLDLWIVDCLRHDPAPTHAHLDLTLSWIDRYKPKRAVLTHLSHDFDYETLKALCPPNVEPAYDGMILHGN